MTIQNRRPLHLAPFAAIAFSLLGLTLAQAQHNFEQWNGGDGTWDAGTTADWNGNQVWVNSIARDTSATPAVGTAYFGSAPGTVTIDDSKSTTPVTYGYMEFNSGGQAGNWVFNGGPLDDVASDFTATVLQIDGGQTANVTFNAQINIAPNPTNGGSVFFNGGNGTTLTIGNINISNTPITYNDGAGTHTSGAPLTYTRNDASTYTVNSQTPIFYGLNGTTTILKGNYTSDTGVFGGMLIGNYGDANMATATYVIEGGLDVARSGNKQFDFGSGNIILATSDTGTGDMVFVGAGANLAQTLLTRGAQTIGNRILNQGASNAIIGGSDASASTYTGFINAGGSGGELTLRAAAGGTVTFSGQIDGDNNATTKDGLGTVILSHATGNTWTTHTPDAFEMKAGKTIITNTSGDAFGNGVFIDNNGVPAFTGPAFAQLDAGAKLAGTGITGRKLVAMGATSEISPGLDNAVGTMTLINGLSATNGLTMDFKLDGDASAPGVNNDELSLGGLTLSGLIKINISVLGGTVDTTHAYELMAGTGNWTDNGAIFDINAPAGYTVDLSYGADQGTFGYEFNNPGDNSFSVKFVAIPEPSTYALMGLGLLALVAIRRWKSRVSSL